MHTPVFRIITVNVQCFVYYIYVHVLLIAKYLEMFIFIKQSQIHVLYKGLFLRV